MDAPGREHVAIGVTQGEHVLRLAELLAESLENGDPGAQRFQLLPSLAPLVLGQHDRASVERRIDLKHVATSQPRVEHHGRHDGLPLAHDELRPRPLTCGLGNRRAWFTRPGNGWSPLLHVQVVFLSLGGD